MMTIDPKTASFEELRSFMGTVIGQNPNSRKLWDLITCLRGPDSPSERPDMNYQESSAAYDGRRERKARTVEVIRFHAFGGVVGGSARSRGDRSHVELPPRSQWDHFDKHVERAARAIGLEVRVEEEKKADKRWAIEISAPSAEAPVKPVKYKSKSFLQKEIDKDLYADGKGDLKIHTASGWASVSPKPGEALGALSVEMLEKAFNKHAFAAAMNSSVFDSEDAKVEELLKVEFEEEVDDEIPF